MSGLSRTPVILLTLLLLFGTAHCVMSCIAAPCVTDSPVNAAQKDMPPCHRHNESPTNKASVACSHPLLIADTTHVPDGSSLAPQWTAAVTFTPAALSALSFIGRRIFVEASFPPRGPQSNSVVLRI
jgi:hypothetical protein